MNLTQEMTDDIVDRALKNLRDNGSFPITSSNHNTVSNYPSIGTISIDSFTTDTVRGEMVFAEIVVTDFELTQMELDEDLFKEEMKKKLARHLAEQIMENKLVEFTKQQNFNKGETTFRARAYLTPDNQVRMLRKASK